VASAATAGDGRGSGDGSQCKGEMLVHLLLQIVWEAAWPGSVTGLNFTEANNGRLSG
jgi:hypothetical protein